MWLNELIWREFYRHLMTYHPDLCKHRPFIRWTEQVQWQSNEKLLKAWQHGLTGFPIVDAAMRQLNETGWMHNRLRMITASFLVKDLLIDWRTGERYFISQLIDGDLAANNGGWQWAASTGTDAAPYFRIFNPTTQGQRFDVDGEFIRRWLPELKDVPAKAIHEPWAWADKQRVTLNYPRPLSTINRRVSPRWRRTKPPEKFERMMMKNSELERLINEKLNTASFSDYGPNGLQVEGRETVQKIITGVTASQALLDEAVRQEADAVIVHHGYFWKNESPIIRGMKRNRLKTLLANDINLYGYHLPLDAHPELGNNVQLAQLLGITVMGEIEPLVPWGELSMPVPGLELASWIEARLGRRPLWCGDTGPDTVKRVAWCTGGGQGFIDSAARFGVDAFITGEVSEQTIHSAREQGLHFYAAGHHATERGGIRALSEWLTENTDLDVTFIDIPNPA